MADLKYEEIEFVPPENVRTEVESGDPERVSKALYSSTAHGDDSKWLQDQCIFLLSSEHIPIRWAAATCLGQLAWLKRPIDGIRVLGALQEVSDDLAIADPVSFSIDLVKHFAIRIQ